MYRILLGGLGDDAHSIGISLIKIALEDQGFLVSYIGIQNTIYDFIKYSEEHDIIFVSCINGHSELYLDQDDYNLNWLQYKGNKLWYVGGNLSVDKSDDYIVRLYKEKGFTRIFPKPIGVDELLFHLKEDIKYYHVAPEYTARERFSITQTSIELNQDEYDEMISDSKFEQMRKEVLTTWETGSAVTYERAMENQRKSINMDGVLWDSHSKKKLPIIQPRTGVADIEKQMKLLNILKAEGMGIASVQLDAASRRLYFDKAKEGLEISLELGSSMLNGFPIPIHGINGVERLSHSFGLPFQIRGGAPDHKFVYELSIAGGASSVEGGFLCYLLPYEKKLSPVECLKNWSYVDRLCGIYHNKMNIKINREFFGPLTTTLIEPSLPIVINIVETLSAARWGVKSIAVGLAEQGNRCQDIAGMQVLSELVQKYLLKYKYGDVRVTTIFHQYMGAFPTDELRAEKLIEESAITAALSNATRVITKTPVEALKIPDAYDNCRGMRLTKKGLQKAADTHSNREKIKKEKRMLEEEVISIMNVIEHLGEGNLEAGAIKALRNGIIDVPFSPSLYNRGEMLVFRNTDGAIRYANVDRMPFPEWIREIHKNDFRIRKSGERNPSMYSIIEQDITRISKNDYKQWPLDGTYI